MRLTDFAAEQDQARAVTILPDGKLIAAGFAVVSRRASHPTSPTYDSYDFAVARYNSDGSLDSTFDNDGKATTDIAKSFDIAWAVAVQSDKKIVLAGGAVLPTIGRTMGDDFGLARYNDDGSLDTAFDGDGKLSTDFAGNVDFALAVAIQRDGKIVAAGGAYATDTDDFALARYNTDGSLDPTFGGDGKVNTEFAGRVDVATAVAIQHDGKIVTGGRADVVVSDDFALARYNDDGSLDSTFGADGKVTTDFAGGFDQAQAVAIQGDGKIVAAGFAYVSGNSHFALARYTICRPSSSSSSVPCR